MPHDYVISQTPAQEKNNAAGFFHYKNAWYRRKFTISKEKQNKRITLLFEGVATHATVYLNGCVLKRNFCGYNSFEVEITDFVKFDAENTLAVYVSTSDIEEWWYKGGGIYRNVYLIFTEPVAIDLWGVYAMPKKVGDLWRADVETEIINDTYGDVTVEAVTAFCDEDGNQVAEGRGQVFIPLRDKGKAKYSVVVEDPKLWDIDHPYLYTVKTKLYLDGTVCDEYIMRTGFRSFQIDPVKGLFLNGKHVKIKGVCASGFWPDWQGCTGQHPAL